MGRGCSRPQATSPSCPVPERPHLGLTSSSRSSLAEVGGKKVSGEGWKEGGSDRKRPGRKAGGICGGGGMLLPVRQIGVVPRSIERSVMNNAKIARSEREREREGTAAEERGVKVRWRKPE